MDFDRSLDQPGLFRVAFVCTGNICRSPMAEVVFRSQTRDAGLGSALAVVSAATGDWHVGERADERTIAALARRGFDASEHRAKQFDPEWFPLLDLVIAFDRGQQRILQAWASTPQDRAKVKMLLSFDPEHGDQVDVPDPYYSDQETFDRVLGMIDRATESLFRQLEPAIRQGAA